MKLMINGYEVEIKARATWSKRATKLDAMHFLNSISILAFEAAEYNRMKFGEDCGKYADRISDEIFEVLKANGLYK